MSVNSQRDDTFKFEISSDDKNGTELFPIPKDWFKLSHMLKDYCLPEDKIIPLKNCTVKHLKMIAEIIEYIRNKYNAIYKFALLSSLDATIMTFDELNVLSITNASNTDRIITANLADYLQMSIAKKYLLQFYAFKILETDERHHSNIIDLLGSTPLTAKDCEDHGLAEDETFWTNFPTAKRMIFSNKSL